MFAHLNISQLYHIIIYMTKRHRALIKYIIGGVIGAAVIAVGVCFLVQYMTKTGVFRVPGVVYYDESLNEEELAKVQGIFTEEVDLDYDVTISAKNVLELEELSENEFLLGVFVPVTDFYSLESDITVESADEMFTNCLDCKWELIDVDELSFERKLLKINGHYYLDEFNRGAVYRILEFQSESYGEEIAPLIAGQFEAAELPSKETVLTLAQTGVTALSRGMNRKLYEVEDAKYFAEKIGKYLSGFDLTHTSNESSFTAYATVDNICSDNRFINTLTAIGLDIVELTGNHNVDCGDEAANSTIDLYKKRGIKIVGGGKTADEAAVPLEIDQKGNKITILAFNESTGGATYDDTPGANQYYEETAAAQIAEAKKRGDFVIVDIQYYECSMYASEEEDATCDAADSAAGDQVGFFRHLIDLGADVVVGTSAHQPQTYELYGDGVIYYGLGNLFFDQVWWPGTTRSLILVHHFYKDKLLQTEIVPTVYDSNMQTALMDEETKAWFLKRLMSVRP